MDWSDVTRRVVIEAVEAHPQDRVLDLGCGDGRVLAGLAHRIASGVGVDRERQESWSAQPANLQFRVADLRHVRQFWPPGTSVVLLHDSFRYLNPLEQRTLLRDLGQLLPERGLLVLGDIIWSLPPVMIDEPEAFGPDQEHAPTAAALEEMVRGAGFLPDLHRFGPGRAVLIALKAGKG